MKEEIRVVQQKPGTSKIASKPPETRKLRSERHGPDAFSALKRKQPANRLISDF